MIMVVAQCTKLGNDERYQDVGTSNLLASFAGRSVAEEGHGILLDLRWYCSGWSSLVEYRVDHRAMYD